MLFAISYALAPEPGRGLAARFLQAGSEVLVTGRSAQKLGQASTELPGLKTLVNDIGLPGEREKLAAYIAQHLPGINVVINNAGIQRRIGLAADHAPWAESQQEIAPVYSACKAALHSYTVTLRHALAATPVRVVELIPPAVATALAGTGNAHGAPLDDFCDKVFALLIREDVTDIGYGPTENLVPQLSGKPVGEYFEASAARFPVDIYHQAKL